MSGRTDSRAETLIHSRSDFLVGGTSWKKVAAELSSKGLWDVYFDSAYIDLYAGGTESRETEAFYYAAGGDHFFLPYLKAPIPGHPGLWDFHSAYGYGGALATTSDKTFLSAAWKTFSMEALAKGLICGLLRFHPLLATERFAASPVDVISDRDTVWLDLQRPAEEIFSDYSKENRRKLRRAMRDGVTANAQFGEPALVAFSELYSRRMNDLTARPEYFFGVDYFKSIAGLGPDAYRIYLCHDADGELIGGALLLLSPQFVHYHLSASRKEYFHLAPNNVLRDQVIRDFLGGTRSAIHFGGGVSGDPADTLLAFKLNFSRQVLRFHVGTCVLDAKRYESVCRDWIRAADPDRQARFGKFVLRYRY